MKSRNRIRHELMASPNKPRQRPRENRQTNFLHVLTQAESIQDACAAVGVTCLALGQSSSREKEVHTSVLRAPSRMFENSISHVINQLAAQPSDFRESYPYNFLECAKRASRNPPWPLPGDRFP